MNIPDAAAPHNTPQIKGAQVTGFVSCNRIFHLFCSPKSFKSSVPCGEQILHMTLPYTTTQLEPNGLDRAAHYKSFLAWLTKQWEEETSSPSRKTPLSFLTVSAAAPFMPSSWFTAEPAASAASAAFGATSGILEFFAATSFTPRFVSFDLLKWGPYIQYFINYRWLLNFYSQTRWRNVR